MLPGIIRMVSPMKKIILAVLCALALCGLTALYACASSDTRVSNAEYLGIENYGSVSIEEAASFKHRFLVDGVESQYLVSIENDYALENSLMEGYVFDLTVEDGTVTSAALSPDSQSRLESSVRYSNQALPQQTPGQRTLKNFLITSLVPVGTTLYIYGGGWNWQDDGSAPQASTLGISSTWIDFFQSQDSSFTYNNEGDPSQSYYPNGAFNQFYFAGLDCSGYVGWSLYNTLNSTDGVEGFVEPAASMATTLAEVKGYGTFSQDTSEFRTGDIFSLAGHVWICLGSCADGSLVILHSTPSESFSGYPGGGVQISAVGTDEDCEAYKLATEYMRRYYPDWNERYAPVCKSFDQYTEITGDNSGRFSWYLDDRGLNDPDGYAKMTPQEILEDLFQEQ